MDAVSAVEQVRLGPASAARCRRRIHLDADPTADRSLRSPLNDGNRHRLADTAAHRGLVLAQFAATAALDPDWTPERPDRPALLLAPSLQTATRVGTPDLLVWSGDGYVPVIVRNHRTTDPGAGAELSDLGAPLSRRVAADRRLRVNQADALTLAHYVRLLEECGIASDRRWGGVIGRGLGSEVPAAGRSDHNDAEVIVWYELESSGVLADYDRRFADRLEVAEHARNGGPALAQPSRIGECRRCSWWPVCSAELTAAHDISLISAGEDVEVLRAIGVRTVDQLAALPKDLIKSLPLTGVPAESARTRARAWLTGTPLVRADERSGVLRADVELDVDMESYLDDGAYLWGTYLTGSDLAGLDLEPGYRPFVTWRTLPDDDEGRAFAGFWAYLTEVRRRAAEAGRTFAAYCYSRSAEERWMRAAPRRFSQVPGVPSAEEVSAFCAGPQWVDIYQQIREQYVVPGSLKLKVLAPLSGFAWRDVDPGGENSMAWYRAAIGGVLHAPDAASAERVLQYNEDDVRATLALREYLTDRAEDLPTVADLDRD